MKKVMILMLLIVASSCSYLDIELKGKWYMDFHDAAYEGDGLQQIAHSKPFDFIEFNFGDVIIDGKKTTYQKLDGDYISIDIDGQSYKFFVSTTTYNGKKMLMLTSLEYTPKDISAYYLVKT
jgi:hypothetical protein